MFYIRPRSFFTNTGELLNLYKKSLGKSSQLLVYIFSCCNDKIQKSFFIFTQEEDWVVHWGTNPFWQKLNPRRRPLSKFVHQRDPKPPPIIMNWVKKEKPLFLWIFGWDKCIDILSIIFGDIYCNKEYLEVSFQKVIFIQSHK